MNSMQILLSKAVSLGLLRNLDVQFAYFLVDNNNPARLLVSAFLSAAVGKGHTCLPLCQLKCENLFNGTYPELSCAIWQAAEMPKEWFSIFNGWLALSTNPNKKITPIILDKNRLYLHRLWKYEEQLAAFFKAHSSPTTFKMEDLQSILDLLFNSQETYDSNKMAVTVALTKKISMVSTEIGADKATVVAKLLVALIKLNKGTLRIKMVAPTMKSAVHLSQSVINKLEFLPLRQDEKKCLPKDAITIQQLLKINPQTHRVFYNINNPLPLDVLIIDQAFMLDLTNMVRLTSALSLDAKVIFLNDLNTLSVGGSILSDICRYHDLDYNTSRVEEFYNVTNCNTFSNTNINKSFMYDSIFLLRNNNYYHPKFKINLLARAVHTGNYEKIKSIFKTEFSSFKYQSWIDNPDSYNNMLNEIVENYIPFLYLVNKCAKPKEILLSFERYQVLCALRDGKFGTQELNKHIEEKLMKMQLIKYALDDKKWYHGKPIIVTNNDNLLGISNREIGITLYNTNTNILKVFFLQSDGAIKTIPINRFSYSYDTAWAITVHQSQELQFDHTALILPIEYFSLLTRELLYTAISTVRKQLTLYTDDNILLKTIQQRKDSYSGLLERLSN